MKRSTAMKELKYQINYGSSLMSTIVNYPALLEGSKATFEAVAQKIREEFDSGEGSLIHGDFWSGK